MIHIKSNVNFFSLLILGVLSGCLYISVEKDVSPLIWHGNNDLVSHIELPTGRAGWAIGVKNRNSFSEILPKLAKFEVKCIVINTGNKPLYFRWSAYSELEKQNGELVVKYEDREIRRKLLKPGMQLLWYAGNIKGLFNKGLQVFDPQKENSPLKFSLKLEFLDSEHLKKIVNMEEFKIPVIATTGDNV